MKLHPARPPLTVGCFPRQVAGLSLILAFALVSGLGAVANPIPFADAFALRGQITGESGSGEGSNTAASAEPGEPAHGGLPVGRTLWVSWVAPAHGLARLTTDGSKFDTVLAVYADEAALRGGNPNNPPPPGLFARLREVAINDDADEQDALHSRVEFPVRAGVRYEIMVGGYAGAGGEVKLAWEIEKTDYPLPVLLHRETDRAVTNGAPASLAFEVLAPSAVQFQWFRDGMALPGATAATLALPAVSTNQVGRYALRVTALNPDPDDANATVFFSRHVELQVAPADRPGQLARDKVLGWSESGHTGGLHQTGEVGRGRRTLAVPALPPLTPSRGYTGTQIFDTTAARRDPGEPFHCGLEGGATYWYRYTAAAAGELWFDTYGSGFDTVLAVYTFNPPLTGYAGLIPVACSDDEPFAEGRSRVTFPAVAGRDYLVVVDGKQGARGKAVLNWAFTPAGPAAPVITGHPQPATVLRGQNATLAVEATGTGLAYQWRRGGVPIPGATARQLSLTGATLADDALYDVIVRNAGGRVVSRAARLQVAEPPALLSQPVAHAVAAGGTLRLAVAATGTGPLAYQWRRNGVNLAGQTNATLVRTAFTAALAGTYDVRVTSPYGAVTSRAAAISLAPAAANVSAPVVTLHPPASRTVRPGDSVTLGTVATGDAPLRCQWYRNGAALPGATNHNLTLDAVTAAHAGAYQVVFQNAAGQAASAVARLHVTAAPVPRMASPGGMPAVIVPSLAGPQYTLECRASAAGGGWQSVATLPGTGGQLTFTNLPAGPARFFRVVAR